GSGPSEEGAERPGESRVHRAPAETRRGACPIRTGAIAGAGGVRAGTPGRLALAAVTVLAFLLRVPSIAEPLGIDQGLYASAAKALSRGYVFYRDVWGQKPPTPFLVYRAAFDLFGWRTATVAWLDLLASAATATLLYVTLRRLSRSTVGLT